MTLQPGRSKGLTPQTDAPNAFLLHKAFHIAMIGLACGCCFVALFPGTWVAQKVSTTAFFAQMLAFPIPLGIGILCAAFFALILCKVKARGTLASSSCTAWALAALAFLLFPDGLPTSTKASLPEPTHRVLSVVTFNAAATLTPAGFQELISAYHPDVVILPETSEYEARRALAGTDFAGTLFTTPNEGFGEAYNGLIAPTTVVVSEKLGPARPATGPATSFGTVSIEFDRPGLPTIIGIHTAPPLPGLMSDWKEDLARVVAFGESSQKPVLIAGDFNATLRHGALARRTQLTDAQQWCSSRSSGTWNSQFPKILQTPIDHILLSPGLRAESCSTKKISGSDHLALYAEIVGQ